MTRSEQRLWQTLRGKRLNGVRFRRQHVLGPYVVDFYCSAARLAIEIDGGVHEDEEVASRDALRDRWITSQGVRMLRIPDRNVEDDLDGVLRTILATVNSSQFR